MLDAAFIRENLDAVKANCKNRNVKADVDRVVALDDERRRLIQQTDAIKQRQNEVSKLMPKEKDPARKQELIAEGKRLKESVAGQDKQLKQVEEKPIKVERGVISHAASRREGRFGQFAQAAARLPVPTDAKLKDPSAFRLIGSDNRSVKRLDSAAKLPPVATSAFNTVPVKLLRVLLLSATATPIGTSNSHAVVPGVCPLNVPAENPGPSAPALFTVLVPWNNPKFTVDPVNVPLSDRVAVSDADLNSPPVPGPALMPLSRPVLASKVWLVATPLPAVCRVRCPSASRALAVQ